MRRWELEQQQEEKEEVVEEDVEEKVEGEPETVDIKELADEHERSMQSKSHMGVLISVCIFFIVLVATITTVAMTVINNKKRVENARAREAFQEQNSDLPIPADTVGLQDDEHAEEVVATITDRPSLNYKIPAETAYMGFMLNGDYLPAYECDAENYERHSATIKVVTYFEEMFTDEEAQDIFNHFASWLTLADVMEEGHVLFIMSKDEDNWYQVCDELDDAWYYINTERSLCYKDMFGLSPEELYNIDRGVNEDHEVRSLDYTLEMMEGGGFSVDCYACDTHYFMSPTLPKPVPGYTLPLNEWLENGKKYE